jgi:hypothetical protein
MSSRFRGHQIVSLLEFASIKPHIALSSRSIAPTFEVSHSAIARTKLRGYEDLPRRWRDHQLDADSEQELIDWIANKATNNTAVNKTQLLHECNERLGKKITRGWVDSLVTCHAEELLQAKTAPQQNARLEVRQVFVETAIKSFETMFIIHVLNWSLILMKLRSVNGKIGLRDELSLHRR